MTVAYATHRLSGIITPANATYTVEELAHQLRTSGSKAVFTCPSLLETALQAAEKTGIPCKNVYVLELPTEPHRHDTSILSVEEMIHRGYSLPPLQRLTFGKGQGTRQTAFLCYSSGTSGQPVSILPPAANRCILIDGIVESRHDLPLQCHREHPAAHDI